MQVTMITLDQLQPDPDQPRKHFDDKSILELASSILANGVMTPLEVRPNGSDTTFVITAGERRYRALTVLTERGMTIDVPVIIRETHDADVMVRQIVENVQREDMLPMEEARAYAFLRDEQKLSQKDIASAVGKSPTHVGRRLGFLRLPERVQTAIDTGEVSIEVAAALAKVKDLSFLDEYEDHEIGWLDLNDIAKVVDKEEKAAALAKAVKAVEAHGLVVISRMDMHDANRAARNEAEDKAEVKSEFTWTRLGEDFDRSFEPGTLGEAKLKRSDKAILVHQQWDGTIQCVPVVATKESATRYTGATQSTEDTGIRVDATKRDTAVTKAYNQWLLAQDTLIVAQKHPKADVLDLVCTALVATCGIEPMEQAAKTLDVDLLTKTERRGYGDTLKEVEVPDYKATLLGEIAAGGVRQQRALLAVAMAKLAYGYGDGRDELERFRTSHDFVPFARDAFIAEWEAAYVAREEKKRTKAAEKAAAEALTTDPTEHHDSEYGPEGYLDDGIVEDYLNEDDSDEGE